jgi:hypothetical protein
VSTALLGLVLVLGGAAQAEEAKTKRRDSKSKFYNFDELLVGGELRAPNAYFTTSRQRMRWGRLLRLRKSFVPVLMATDRYPVLRSPDGE